MAEPEATYRPDDDELSVEELEEAAGGGLADNTNCGSTCNTNCTTVCGPVGVE